MGTTMKINPMFSPQMAALYLILIMFGAIVLDDAQGLLAKIIGSAMIVSGMVGCFFTIIRNR